MARYKELRQRLEQEIVEGVYRVGDKFPTDFELRERFGVSRHTVREALRALQEEGVLERQPGSGTVVRAMPTRDVYAQTVNSLDELSEYAADTVFDVRQEGLVTAREGLAQLLGVKSGGRWLRLAGVRRFRAEGRLASWSELFVAEEYAAVREDVRKGGGPIYDHIARRFGVLVSEVEQRVSAVKTPAEMADVLGLEPGEPSLMVRRRYFATSDAPFEISLNLHPGDRYAYTARLTRGRRGSGS